MKQGTCTRCNHIVYFFTDITLEAATPTAAPLPTVRVTTAAATSTRRYGEPPTTLPLSTQPWLTTTRMYLAGGIIAVVLLIVIISFIKSASTPVEPLNGDANINADYISITNNNNFTWSEVQLTLNDDYTYAVSTASIPSHGTVHFPISQFTKSAGHAFNPASQTPQHLKIEAKDSNKHSGILEIDFKR
jgi:hypothetical protein